MANHPSAERRNRQRIKRSGRNRSIRSGARRVIRKAREALGAGDKERAAGLTRQVESLLDRAASKGTIHRKMAARIKARLYKRLHVLGKQA